MANLGDKIWAALIGGITAIAVTIINPMAQDWAKVSDVKNELIEIVNNEDIEVNAITALPVGTIVSSFLNETRFVQEAGDRWVLADGRSVVGSEYAISFNEDSVPDLSGMFLRGTNMSGSGADPDGDRDPASVQNSQLQAHGHLIPLLTTGYSKHNQRNAPGGVGNPASIALRYDGEDITVKTGVGAIDSTVSGEETRPINVAINYFIRVN